jgi:hypothetical protein
MAQKVFFSKPINSTAHEKKAADAKGT